MIWRHHYFHSVSRFPWTYLSAFPLILAIGSKPICHKRVPWFSATLTQLNLLGPYVIANKLVFISFSQTTQFYLLQLALCHVAQYQDYPLIVTKVTSSNQQNSSKHLSQISKNCKAKKYIKKRKLWRDQNID